MMKDAVTGTSTRRDFVRLSALGLAIPALAACDPTGSENKPVKAESPAAGVTAAAAPKAELTAKQKSDEMDRMHEAGIKAFPAKTEGKGNQPLVSKMVGGVRVFEITVGKVQWEVDPGNRVEAWTYNGVVPGPQIRVKEGERVRINVRNDLDESTAVHFHGVELPNDQDGVPFITQPPIKPGASFTYEFTAPNPGSHMYHSHHNSAKQVGMGLLGAFIIEPKVKRAIENVDIDYVMILNDGFHGFTLNGKGFPATEPIVAKLGQKLRVRFMNEGMMIHPMHLHGMHMTVIDKDGWPLPAPFRCDTLNIAPGERWDVIVNCNNPGTWAFHCHILPHAESDHGMYGMVTALIVQKQ
jgi:FtsP/CotA-like multicopper oxidase with cupredoxin domain